MYKNYPKIFFKTVDGQTVFYRYGRFSRKGYIVDAASQSVIENFIRFWGYIRLGVFLVALAVVLRFNLRFGLKLIGGLALVTPFAIAECISYRFVVAKRLKKMSTTTVRMTSSDMLKSNARALPKGFVYFYILSSLLILCGSGYFFINTLPQIDWGTLFLILLFTYILSKAILMAIVQHQNDSVK